MTAGGKCCYLFRQRAADSREPDAPSNAARLTEELLLRRSDQGSIKKVSGCSGLTVLERIGRRLAVAGSSRAFGPPPWSGRESRTATLRSAMAGRGSPEVFGPPLQRGRDEIQLKLRRSDQRWRGSPPAGQNEETWRRGTADRFLLQLTDSLPMEPRRKRRRVSC